ncbi:hypothetical protein RA2_04197 [Roseovarius sp. A-2]|uniref:hypothetical protein n=1 Tax=Roseovarius sp. A-2 TaxID=1570360 RepID=UPI0009B5789C|nr:hypothetical protein [Roseovarius sp. A-2]GAW37122.1 hypothetical protein RA2_04197 [Roseovarius sp. A-2]
MTIDFTRVITAGDKAAAAAEARAMRIKAECRARILAVVSEAAQANIAQAGVIYVAMRSDGVGPAQARGAVGLAEGDLDTVAMWKAWVTAMQTECRRAIAEGVAPVWPDVPERVAEMATRF